MPSRVRTWSVHQTTAIMPLLLTLLTALIVLSAELPASTNNSEWEAVDAVVLVVSPPDSLLEMKSPNRALVWSTGGTFLPIAAGSGVLAFTKSTSASVIVPSILVMAYGAYVGPGMGHRYAGNSQAARRGTAIRLAATGGALLGGLAMLQAVCIGPGEGGDCGSDGIAGVGAAIAIASGAALVGSLLYDIHTAPVSAVRWNERRGFAKPSVRVRVQPPRYRFPELQVQVRF